jgi:hypothetical protein
MGWIPRERGAANNKSSQPHQLTWKTKEIKLIVLDTSGNSVHKSQTSMIPSNLFFILCTPTL